MEVCGTAEVTIDQARVARMRGDGDALDGHALYTRLKVAAALALYAHRFNVNDQDWELAGHLMAVSDHTRARITDALRRAEEARNDARGHADAKRARIMRNAEESDALAKARHRIMTVIRDQTDWMTHSDVRRRVGYRHREFFDDAIELLLKDGEIPSRDISRGSGGHGGAGAEYRSAG
jgi:hypothetical protein